MRRNHSAPPGYVAATVFFLLMLAGYLVMAGVFWLHAPARVPSHFNGSNDVDDWSSKGSFLLTMSLLGVALPLLFAVPWPWHKRPQLLHVPNKNYWLQTAHVQGLNNRMNTFMRLFAGLLCGFVGALYGISLAAARSSRPSHAPPAWAFPLVMVVFLVGLGLSTVKLHRDFTPPATETGDAGDV